MYAASTTSTTTSASRLVDSAGALADRRVRVVRLLRPRRTAPAFGFSFRGGKEHTTGFFISKVEFNSEAHHQGLKVGDQLVSINGYRVGDAIHNEMAHYIATQTRLKVKVRNVAMIPVKDKPHEALSWQFVSDRAPSLSSGASSSPTLCHETERFVDMRLSILVPLRAKLGCGICKGPEWKPGIFVQFVRDGGIAREAGLRPGDQIMSCNGLDFSNISFNEAISTMKASGRLELVVREGAGIELVSPESSGYNSSASSAAGERSPAPPAPAPPAALRRKLASVAEEAADRADRLNVNRVKRRTWGSVDFSWKDSENIHSFDVPSDIEPDYDSPSIPNNPHSYDNQIKNLKKKEYTTSPSNKTIINLTEDGATIQCSYDNQSPRKTTFSSSGNKDDKKTIVVEVHHMKAPKCGNSCKPPPMKEDLCCDSSSLSSSVSLSSAIAEEIQRRKMLKKTQSQENINPPEVKKKTSAPKPVENEMKKQHDALMDEFKKVHKKMFANQELTVDNNALQKEAVSLDRQQTLPLRKANDVTSEVITNGHQCNAAADNPPPPPPMPISNGEHNGFLKSNGLKNGDLKKTISQMQAKINSELTQNGASVRNGTNIRQGSMSRTPTPDYIKTEPLSQVKLKSGNKDEKADMESLESYKLKNPSSVQPKPPNTYFMRAPNGTATMKKHVRPVSVTIGEYGVGGGVRRQPSKLEFLSGSDKPDGNQSTEETSVTNRLQSELALTLSRSNLRKKTDTVDRQRTPPLRRANDVTSEVITNGQQSAASDNPPPPPPPMPTSNSEHNGDLKQTHDLRNGDVKKTINKMQDKINSILTQNGSNIGNSENIRQIAIRRTPTPDCIKTKTLSQVKLKNEKKDEKSEKADMESLESYKLREKKYECPMSVTNGTYGKGRVGVRRQASMIELHSGSDKADYQSTVETLQTNRLPSELALTLSRQRLRKIIDNVKAISNGEQNGDLKSTNSLKNSDLKKTISQMQAKINSELTKNGSCVRNDTKMWHGSMRKTPTPNYIKTEPFSQVRLGNRNKDEKADMESNKLKNPSSVLPKPPTTDFMRAPNGTTTEKKNVSPMSVTIGAYGTGRAGVRRQASMLEFRVKAYDQSTVETSAANTLQSELALTLSRYKLRKMIDTMIAGAR